MSLCFTQQIRSLAHFVESGGPERMREYDEDTEARTAIRDSLEHHGDTFSETIQLDTGLSKSAVSRNLNEMLAAGEVTRTDSIPYIWRLRRA